MRKEAEKEDYLRSIGVRLLRIPNGLVLEDPEGFVCRVREHALRAKQGMTPHPARPGWRKRRLRATLSPGRGLKNAEIRNRFSREKDEECRKSTAGAEPG